MNTAAYALHADDSASSPLGAHGREVVRTPGGRAAMWWVIASEVVIFGGFIVCYLLYRIRHPEWAEASAHTNAALGALNTLVLITSSLFAARAQQATERGDPDRASHLLSLTMLFSVAFLGVKSLEWGMEIHHGFTIGSHLFWSFYFGMTGLHAVHIVAGFIAMAAVMPELDKGRNLHRVEMVGMYWHLVDVVWIFLFALLYVIR